MANLFRCTQLLLLSLFASSAFAAPEAPTGLSGTLDGTSVSLEWQAVEQAIGYNVYSNDQYLATTTETRYEGVVEEGSVTNFYVTAFSSAPVEFSARSGQITLPESAIPDDLTIPPSVPANLTGEIDGTSVSLEWDASTDDESVAGYNVYENNQYLTTVFDTHYSGSVVAGELYSYSVVAFDVRVNFSAASEPLRLPDTGPVDRSIPPTSPTSLTGSIDGTRVSLQWHASTDDRGVAGYNVYENDDYKTTVFNTAYEGQVNEVSTTTYYVVAFDYDGNFAQKSSRLSLPDGTMTAEDAESPSAPVELSGNWDDGGATATITLNWNESTDNVAVAGYNVYENNQYVTTVFDTAYTTTVNSDGNYSYGVVAFDIARNFSAQSERLTLPDRGNIAPTFSGLDDVVAFAGDTVTIRVRPIDTDGDVPGLFIGTLPEGMSSEDNLDGSRMLRWRPLQPDVGIHDIKLTAFDAADPSLTTVRTMRVTIELPEDTSGIRNEPPQIDLIEDHIVRTGDTVVMEVKANDPNGTVPVIALLNQPADSVISPHESEPNIIVFKWDTNTGDEGINNLQFVATDAEDSALFDTADIKISVVDPGLFVRPGQRLKTLAQANDLHIGYASLLRYYRKPDGDLYQSVAAEEFTMLTSENSMKWGYINPEPDVYRFDAADAEAEFADANDMLLHGHTLVWYTALPQWVQQSAPGDRENIMNNFIDQMTSRYSGVDVWDVVNEAFEDDGSYRNSVWHQAMGKQYIEKAFRRARAGAPDAQLIYNDYDIAYGAEKTDAAFSLMEDLIADDVPIDGIGFQMHVGADFSDFDRIADTFTRFANLGLDIYVTEMDVSIRNGTTELDQANVYSQITRICLATPACKALQVWGITDRYSWLKEHEPLLLDRNYQPKPAYSALQQALQD